nr:hypothetical protein CFP56_02899 [Quercus suber]POF13880.1 hypothetical protein CFP56_02904 [Quercus suber]
MENKLTGIEDSLALVRLKCTDSAEDAVDRSDAIRQLEDITLLVEAQKALADLLANANEKSIRRAINAPAQTLNVTFGANNQGMQIGVSHGAIMFGPRTVYAVSANAGVPLPSLIGLISSCPAPWRSRYE